MTKSSEHHPSPGDQRATEGADHAERNPPGLAVMAERHEVNGEGRPVGGSTSGPGMRIDWQNRPLKVSGLGYLSQTGAQVTDVIRAALGRLRFLQRYGTPCVENNATIDALEQALSWQRQRDLDRTARGVEGTYEP
jgi:hypothetical protein